MYPSFERARPGMCLSVEMLAEHRRVYTGMLRRVHIDGRVRPMWQLTHGERLQALSATRLATFRHVQRLRIHTLPTSIHHHAGLHTTYSHVLQAPHMFSTPSLGCSASSQRQVSSPPVSLPTRATAGPQAGGPTAPLKVDHGMISLSFPSPLLKLLTFGWAPLNIPVSHLPWPHHKSICSAICSPRVLRIHISIEIRNEIVLDG